MEPHVVVDFSKPGVILLIKEAGGRAMTAVCDANGKVHYNHKAGPFPDGSFDHYTFNQFGPIAVGYDASKAGLVGPIDPNLPSVAPSQYVANQNNIDDSQFPLNLSDTGQSALGQHSDASQHAANHSIPVQPDASQSAFNDYGLNELITGGHGANEFENNLSVPDHYDANQSLASQAGPSQYAPSQYAPSQYAPSQYASSQHASSQHASSHYAPNQYDPSQYAPNQYDPSQYAPNQPALNQPARGRTIRRRIARVQAAPMEDAPMPDAPMEDAPNGCIPARNNPCRLLWTPASADNLPVDVATGHIVVFHEQTPDPSALQGHLKGKSKVHPWTDPEIAFLKLHKNTCKRNFLAEHYLVRHTKNGIDTKASNFNRTSDSE